ncbi:hypothetical protein L211DRAFT_185673 [Terfezia boudieri ATCC MYA-4762]|uniref:Uncharacterized protein n=1 Tax=Terfezia boudieri ATCC MYA-4762 TaxID=1051890 RepID=A0A3N4M1U7_9PEZI|nr:hypothetical protein L211DRAFT_185673 [Terfezia boudieri ATCC MYA-4762]
MCNADSCKIEKSATYPTYLPACLPACLHMHDRLTGIYFHVWWLFLHGVMRVSGVPVDTYRVGFEIYWKGTWTSTSCLARLQVWYILPYIHTVYTVHTRHVGRGTWNMDGMWKRVEVILINVCRVEYNTSVQQREKKKGKKKKKKYATARSISRGISCS